MTNDKKLGLVGRWESRGRKYWLELRLVAEGYTYHGDNCGGFLGNKITEEQAFEKMQSIMDSWPSVARRIR